MEKRGLFKGLILSIFLINILFISAYSSSSSFSLGDFFNEFDEETMILLTIMIISFALINYSLVRILRGNKATAGIVAFVASLLITWEVNQMDLDISNFFYGIGISEGFFSTLIPIILIIGSAIIIWRFGLGKFFLVIGLFLLGITFFTDLIYESNIAIIAGIICILIGLWWIRRKRGNEYGGGGDYGSGRFRRGAGAVAGAVGRGAWGATKWTSRGIAKGGGRLIRGSETKRDMRAQKKERNKELKRRKERYDIMTKDHKEAEAIQAKLKQEENYVINIYSRQINQLNLDIKLNEDFLKKNPKAQTSKREKAIKIINNNSLKIQQLQSELQRKIKELRSQASS